MNSLCKVKYGAAGRRGFALVIAIALMGFLLLLSISLATLTQVESNASTAGADVEKARKNAFLGMMAAVGQLQTAAGPDRRAMATADSFDGVRNGANQWLGVWDTTRTNATPVWLVSGETPNPAAAFTNGISIVDTVLGSTATDAQKVQVQRVELPDKQGHFAWWVADQSMKASVRDGWTPESSVASFTLATDLKPDVVKRNLARRVPMRRGAEMAVAGIQPDGADAEVLQNALTLSQLNGVSGAGFNLGESFHNITLSSYGLLTNPIDGGFKYNLTGASSDPHGFLNSSLTAYLRAERGNETGTNANFYSGATTFTRGMRASTKPDGTPYEPEPVLLLTPPTKGGARTPMFPPSNASKGDGYAFYAPILTEFVFRFSLVMTENKTTSNPSNFYIRPDFLYEIWNPYPFTLEFTRQEGAATLPGLRTVITEFKPKITITLRDGATKIDSFEVDMDANLGGKISQNLDILPYIERFYPIVDGRNSAGPAVLYPGEVYAGRTEYFHWEPERFSWNFGLNNVNRWRYPLAGEDSTLSPTPQGGGVWLKDGYSVDIEIDGTFDLALVSRPYYTTYYNSDGADLSNVHLRITNIPINVELEDLPISGAPQRFYYTNSVTELARDDYHTAVHIRLLDTLSDLQRLGEKMDPRKRILDWSEISDLYYHDTHDLGRKLTSLDGNDLFRHDSHAPYGSPEAYRFTTYNEFIEKNRFVKLFDVPTFEPVSMDVFRSVQFIDMPAFSFGEPQSGSSGSTLNAAYDRYFMTGITDVWNPTVKDGSPTSSLPNPNLFFPDWNRLAAGNAAELRTLLAGQDAAEQLLVAGSFDVNSTSVAAWAAALASPQYVGDDMKTPRMGVVLHMPHQPLTDEQITNALTDSQLENLSGNNLRNALFTQTVRVLDNPTSATNASLLYKLAEEIVNEVKEWQLDKGRPFYSMEEFANSGVIKKALDTSRINRIGSTEIPSLSPLYISQAKILGMISNFSNVRGDTFLIRAYGDSVDPATGNTRATAVCEAIVQRMPSFVNPANAPDVAFNSLNTENQTFGRRFHVVAFAWVDNDER